jgi:hypothetical protein
MNKKIIMLGMIFGSLIGGYILNIFGAGMFSLASVFGSSIGGILGIWLTFKFLH